MRIEYPPPDSRVHHLPLDRRQMLRHHHAPTTSLAVHDLPKILEIEMHVMIRDLLEMLGPAPEMINLDGLRDVRRRHVFNDIWNIGHRAVRPIGAREITGLRLAARQRVDVLERHVIRIADGDHRQLRSAAHLRDIRIDEWDRRRHQHRLPHLQVLLCKPRQHPGRDPSAKGVSNNRQIRPRHLRHRDHLRRDPIRRQIRMLDRLRPDRNVAVPRLELHLGRLVGVRQTLKTPFLRRLRPEPSWNIPHHRHHRQCHVVRLIARTVDRRVANGNRTKIINNFRIQIV